MPRTTCEHCGNPLVAPLRLVGKRARCPACGRGTRIMPAILNPGGDVPGTTWRDDLFIPSP